ncbi:hypothetical protein ACRTC3_16600 [Photobacterium damselae]|uniref:hypothetical protein n=1 Tax=Photobacterium damselae TaxID=38293 RepID=UPI003D7C542E
MLITSSANPNKIINLNNVTHIRINDEIIVFYFSSNNSTQWQYHNNNDAQNAFDFISRNLNSGQCCQEVIHSSMD